MLQSNQTAISADESSCESVAVPVLMTTAAALVGALTVYMALRDMTGIL